MTAVLLIYIVVLAGTVAWGTGRSIAAMRAERRAKAAESDAAADRDVAKAIESRATTTARRIIDLETATALLQAEVHRLVRRNRDLEEECADLRAEVDGVEVHSIAAYPLPLRPPT